MAGQDEEDYKFYGTPVEDEEEMWAGQRRKEARDPAATRALPLHKQEVTDEQGRRRFHGAFTGGFSAGYFNTGERYSGHGPPAGHARSLVVRAGAGRLQQQQLALEGGPNQKACRCRRCCASLRTHPGPHAARHAPDACSGFQRGLAAGHV